MTWNFACRRCGHPDYYGSYPFKDSGEFPRCSRCGGETYRPSLEDDLLDMDEAHDSDPEFYYSPQLKAEILHREEEAAHRGIGDIPDAERGAR